MVSVLLGLMVLPGTASAQSGVVFEDYAGRNYVPANPPATTFNNPDINSLLALHASGSGVVRSGTEAGLDWPQTAPRLCVWPDTAVGGNTALSRASCGLHAMGRMSYTVVRMPVAGNIGFYIAHDDNARVDLSTQYQLGTGYRGASWNLPVGALTDYTTDSNTFSRIGSVTSPGVGSCLLLRVAWANTGGRNYMRLGYRTVTGTTTQFFATQDLINPTDSATIAQRCIGAVQAAPTVQLNKVIQDGRAQAADQFRLSLKLDDVVVQVANTTGTNASLAMPKTTVAAGSNGVTIEETAVSGALAPYVVSASCSNVSGGTALALTQVGTAANPRWRLPPLAAGQEVTCTITNRAAASSLALSKSSTPASPWRTGQAVTYTLTARNNGPDAANGAVIRDPAVAGLSCSSVNCQASGSAQCPASPTVSQLQGTGLVLPAFPANGQVVLSLACTVTATGIAP
ncbi:MAG: hypothetical protein ACI4NW_13190 [Stenotrophomonas sp.]